MLALLANGGPPLYPQADAPAGEWAIWGACVGAAILLGGFGVLNRNRPERDTVVGVALLCAMALVAGATLFAMSRGHARQMERNRIEREERDRGYGEPPEPRPPH
ncbi:MAG TPA: hypothetical protein VGE74_04480 [Gemmata sp.]